MNARIRSNDIDEQTNMPYRHRRAAHNTSFVYGFTALLFLLNHSIQNGSVAEALQQTSTSVFSSRPLSFVKIAPRLSSTTGTPTSTSTSTSLYAGHEPAPNYIDKESRWEKLGIDNDKNTNTVTNTPLQWYLLKVVAGTELDMVEKLRQRITEQIETGYLTPKMVETFVVPMAQDAKSHGNRFYLEDKILYPGYIFAKIRLVENAYEIISGMPGLTAWSGPTRRKGWKKLPTIPTAMDDAEVREYKGMEEYVEGGRKETNLSALDAALSGGFVKDDEESNYGVNTAVFTVANSDEETDIEPVPAPLTPLPPVEEIPKLKVAEIKVFMDERKLSTKGKKADLVARLTKFLTKPPSSSSSDPKKEKVTRSEVRKLENRKIEFLKKRKQKEIERFEEFENYGGQSAYLPPDQQKTNVAYEDHQERLDERYTQLEIARMEAAKDLPPSDPKTTQADMLAIASNLSLDNSLSPEELGLTSRDPTLVQSLDNSEQTPAEILELMSQYSIGDMIKVVNGLYTGEDGVVRRFKGGNVLVHMWTYGPLHEEWMNLPDIRPMSISEASRGLTGGKGMTQEDIEEVMGVQLHPFDDGLGRTRKDPDDRSRNKREERPSRSNDNDAGYDRRNDVSSRGQNSNRYVRAEDSIRQRQRDEQSQGRRNYDSDIGDYRTPKPQLREETALSDDADWTSFMADQDADTSEDNNDDDFFNTLVSELESDLDGSPKAVTPSELPRAKPPPKASDDFFDNLLSEVSQDLRDDKPKSSPSQGAKVDETEDDFFATLERELTMQLGDEPSPVDTTPALTEESTARTAAPADPNSADDEDDFFAMLERELSGDADSKPLPKPTDDDGFFATLEADFKAETTTTTPTTASANPPGSTNVEELDTIATLTIQDDDDADDFFASLEKELANDVGESKIQPIAWDKDEFEQAPQATAEAPPLSSSSGNNNTPKRTQPDEQDDFFAQLEAELSGDTYTQPSNPSNTNATPQTRSNTLERQPTQNDRPNRVDNAPTVPVREREDYSKNTVADLKIILKERGLPISGTKNVLISRLTGESVSTITRQKAAKTVFIPTMERTPAEVAKAEEMQTYNANVLKTMLKDIERNHIGSKPELIDRLLVGWREIASRVEDYGE
mmetsp:Transcript_8309/g.10417  ORF Transcript_8309/g.10417 Transcript_8309/m.10417 type:complete len:1127 (-) Transcript_8309:407-3787(-)